MYTRAREGHDSCASCPSPSLVQVMVCYGHRYTLQAGGSAKEVLDAGLYGLAAALVLLTLKSLLAPIKLAVRLARAASCAGLAFSFIWPRER